MAADGWQVDSTVFSVDDYVTRFWKTNHVVKIGISGNTDFIY